MTINKKSQHTLVQLLIMTTFQQFMMKSRMAANIRNTIVFSKPGGHSNFLWRGV